jgi:chorismate mutase
MTNSMLRAIRGATTCAHDDDLSITDATAELLQAMLDRNELTTEDVVSVFFTTTPDLVSTFPAAAARSVGFGDVPLMCASEIAVPGSLERTIRIMMHAYTVRPRAEIRHVYLREAVGLRRDLD